MGDDEQLDKVAEQACRKRGFRLEGFVGGGAFKRTYRVTEKSTDSAFALKILKSGMSLERTSREVSAMKKCCHPNIARLLSVDTNTLNGIDYLVILEEFYQEGTLGNRILNGPVFTRKEVLGIGVMLIDAIKHISGHSLVHRDIKPDNILLKTDKTSPVISDFGLVRDLTETSITQSWLIRGPGTPYYASPEQLNNEKSLIDWRTDQFALGVVLTEALFRIHPFSSSTTDTPMQIVERVATRGEQGSLFLQETIDRNLPVLAKMTRPWPIQRYRTPSALLEAWNGYSKEDT
ncbi:MAG: serine/threonine protein kinase [Planctomycetes bacterium]|nr:serine/threonine protein kinase [Planctomycetota bacterium]